MLHKKKLFHIMLPVLLASIGLFAVFTVWASTFNTPMANTYTVCANDCDFSSIQAAIDAAASADTISLAGETFTEPFNVDNKTLTIQGAGAANTILQAASTPGTASNRVVSIYAEAKVALTGVAIRHGVAPDPGPGFASIGGGIYNVGTLTLTHSIVIDNEADNGGGIFNSESPAYPDSNGLYVSDSTISYNDASFGGGIYNFGGSATVQKTTINGNHASYGGGLYSKSDSDHERSLLTVVNCTIFDNSVSMYGGGIDNGSRSTTNVDNSTIENNYAKNSTGGIRNYAGRVNITSSTIYSNTSVGVYSYGGTVNITNTTISQNTTGISNWNGYANVVNSTIVGNSSYGIYNNDSPFTFTLRNTIVAGHQPSGGDCQNNGILNDLGYNLVEDGSCIDDSTSFAADPKLGSLQDNGGDTHTHALLDDSPAIDAIPIGACAVTEDQRGVSRPQKDACDIGAFELISCEIFLPLVIKH